MESPSSARKNNGTVLHLILKYRLLLDCASKWGVQFIKDTMTWIWSQQNSENENQSHDGMKLLKHDAWECFDMQHSHEAMTYQDEVVDEHEPAKKITLHNSRLINSKSLRTKMLKLKQCAISKTNTISQRHINQANKANLLKKVFQSGTIGL